MANFETIDEARKSFGLSEYATLEEIKNAYRRLAVKYHPDTCDALDKKECESMFKKVTKARDVLMNYCANYRYSFKPDDVVKNGLDNDFDYDHMKRFYDDWMVNF